MPHRPYMSTLVPDEADDLLALGRKVRFRTGGAVFHEGDRSGRVGVVMTGRIKVSCFGEEGREIVLAVRGPGELLGELSAIDGEPHGSSATAMEPAELVMMASAEFKGFLAEHPSAALSLLEAISGRLRDADRKRVEFGSVDTVGRVARRLVELADTYGREEGQAPIGTPAITGAAGAARAGAGARGTTARVAARVHIDLPLSQQELAGWIGASREAVSKALHSLRGRGWIETRRLGITVLDVDALRRRAT